MEFGEGLEQSAERHWAPVQPVTVAIPSLPIGRRGASRVRVDLAAQLQAVRGTFGVTLSNVSRTGALVTGLPGALKAGSEVIIRSGPLDAFGVLVWCRNGSCGLFFEDEIPHDQVIALRDYSDLLARMPEHENVLAAHSWCRGGRDPSMPNAGAMPHYALSRAHRRMAA